MFADVEDFTFIEKIFMCICCIDAQPRTNQCANLLNDSHQVEQNYHTIRRCSPIIPQTHNLVQVSPTPEIATPRPKVQRNFKKVVEVPPTIHVCSRNVCSTSNIVQIPHAATPQAVNSTFEQYNCGQFLPTAAVAPSISRSTINVHNVQLIPTAAKPPQVAKQDVRNTFEPYNFFNNFPTAFVTPPIVQFATNVKNTNNAVQVHPPEIGDETLPPASTVEKPLPNLNNKNGRSSNDNSKLQKDLKKLDASIKNFKHGKKVVPQALRTKFESPEEFQQCIAIHLGKGAYEFHSSSSSLDELDDEYYMNRPSSIFTVQQQNCGEYDTNVQQEASNAVGTRGNNAEILQKEEKCNTTCVQ